MDKVDITINYKIGDYFKINGSDDTYQIDRIENKFVFYIDNDKINQKIEFNKIKLDLPLDKIKQLFVTGDLVLDKITTYIIKINELYITDDNVYAKLNYNYLYDLDYLDSYYHINGIGLVNKNKQIITFTTNLIFDENNEQYSIIGKYENDEEEKLNIENITILKNINELIPTKYNKSSGRIISNILNIIDIILFWLIIGYIIGYIWNRRRKDLVTIES